MSGIQHSTLTDDEFERAVYMALGAAGSLPAEVAQELAQRQRQNGRDLERFHNQFNPQQQPLPFNK